MHHGVYNWVTQGQSYSLYVPSIKKMFSKFMFRKNVMLLNSITFQFPWNSRYPDTPISYFNWLFFIIITILSTTTQNWVCVKEWFDRILKITFFQVHASPFILPHHYPHSKHLPICLSNHGYYSISLFLLILLGTPVIGTGTSSIIYYCSILTFPVYLLFSYNIYYLPCTL